MSTVQNFGAFLRNLKAIKVAAKSLDRVQTRGKQRGQGSIRLMLEGIGDGEILVITHQYDADQLSQLADSIDVIAHGLKGDDREIVKQLGYALLDASGAMNERYWRRGK